MPYSELALFGQHVHQAPVDSAKATLERFFVRVAWAQQLVGGGARPSSGELFRLSSGVKLFIKEVGDNAGSNPAEGAFSGRTRAKCLDRASPQSAILRLRSYACVVRRGNVAAGPHSSDEQPIR
ncbi:hypothetical protein [Novipirellula sp.]|uniref:hypothetical protein n=1 Tax=Novipirellula sp. TaxID=2795430 RepID=UPI003562E3E1